MGPIDDLPLPPYVTAEDVVFALRAVTVHVPERPDGERCRKDEAAHPCRLHRCDSLGYLSVIDFGETTLSEEDAQFLRTRVFCDANLGGAGRCRRRDAHDGPCAAVPNTEVGVSATSGHPDFTQTVSIRE